jgi:hypothetical protein
MSPSAAIAASRVIENPYVPRPMVFRHSSLEGPIRALGIERTSQLFCLQSWDQAETIACKLDIPAEVKVPIHRVRCSGTEALLVVFYVLHSQDNLINMVEREPFNHPTSHWSVAKLSLIFNHTIILLHNRWIDTIKWSRACLGVSRQQYYREKISAKWQSYTGNPLMPPVSALLDATCRPIARPRRGQEATYNGWKRYHCLKYQSVVTPDGMISSLCGPFLGIENDRMMITLSNLKQKWRSAFLGAYKMLADAGYSEDPFVLLIPFPGRPAAGSIESEFNKYLSKIREPVEWPFGDVVRKFPFMTLKTQQRILLRPVARYYAVAVLLRNILNILYPGQVSQFFDCKPPTLDVYLS